MGAKDNYETVTRVVQAFASKNTWQQVELAREVGVEPRTLRKLLTGLSESGMPLERDEEHPHVYWSVPTRWFPGGVLFDLNDWDVLVHAVLRVNNDERRTKLLGRLLSGRNTAEVDRFERLQNAIVGTPLDATEHTTLLLIERSILAGVPLNIRYFSTSGGRLSDRLISPQRLILEPHARLVAYCHENKSLRWFRVDNVERAQLADPEERMDLSAEEVNDFVESSVDGYHDQSNQSLAFVIRGSATSWVRGNLLQGMQIESDRGDSIRVTTNGGAVVVARFIVGLGGMAVAEGDDLRSLVQSIALAAAKAHE